MAKGNVGDRIRVVDGWHGSSEYMNGDEGVIVQTEEGCSGADIRFEYHTEGGCEYLMGKEYELVHETSSATEEAIPWVVGQEVFCLLRGKGVVTSVQANQELWECGVTVKFEIYGNVSYRLDGKVSQGMNRCLFFSEPKIVADKLPPKKKFVPVLNRGDVVIAMNKEGTFEKIVVNYEDEECVHGLYISWYKSYWTFHKLGEKVEFNV